VKARYAFSLLVSTYTFELGPTAETSVGLVLEHPEHQH
jgi:hypothetical protein